MKPEELFNLPIFNDLRNVLNKHMSVRAATQRLPEPYNEDEVHELSTLEIALRDLAEHYAQMADTILGSVPSGLGVPRQVLAELSHNAWLHRKRSEACEALMWCSIGERLPDARSNAELVTGDRVETAG